jgi:transcriptional regulator with XRE-family HTH domain
MSRTRARRRRRRVERYQSLAEFITRTGTPQTLIAARVGTSQANISRIAAGESIPKPALAERIAKKIRIPIESFARVYYARYRARRRVA